MAESMPPERPSTTPLKAVLLDIVAQAQHAGLPVGGVGRRQVGHRPVGAAPAALAALPARHRHAGLELLHLEGERPVAVQAEGAAVEDELVLPAHLVGVDHRQPGLDDARHRDLHALVPFVAPIGRAVRHDQKLGARLRQALRHVGHPDVLADRQADAHAAEIHRPGQRPRLEHADLVEDAVIRQLDLVADGGDAARLQEQHAVVQPGLVDPRACR